MPSTRPISRIIAATVLAATLLVGLTACGDSKDASSVETSTAVSDTVTVTGAWARTSAASQSVGAVYFVVIGGATDDVLLDVSVDGEVAAMAQIHETVVSDGSMSDDSMSDESMSDGSMHSGNATMREIDDVPVPAGGTVEFASGGYHVMLMDLAEPLLAGTTFPMDLRFESAGTLTVVVEVRDG